MTRHLLILTLALAFLPGCKSEPEKAMADLVAKRREVVAVVKTVTDLDSAAAARPRLLALEAETQQAYDRIAAAKLDPAARKALFDQYKPQRIEAQHDLAIEMLRLTRIAGAYKYVDGVATGGSKWSGDLE